MKKENIFVYVMRLVLTLLLITAVTAAALAGINTITEEKIAALQAEKTRQAIAEVLEGAETAQEVAFTDASGVITAVYANDNGYAIQVAPTGFAGTISMMVGVSADGAVTGVSVITHTETAGLGAVAGDDTAKGRAFRDQYTGLSGQLAVTKDGGAIDSISGATITSRAVTDGVNAALAWAANQG